MLSKSQIIYTFVVSFHFVSHYIVLFLRFVNTYSKYHCSRRPKVSFQISSFDCLSDFNKLKLLITLCVELILSYEIFFWYWIITEIALVLLKLNFIVVFFIYVQIKTNVTNILTKILSLKKTLVLLYLFYFLFLAVLSPLLSYYF